MEEFFGKYLTQEEINTLKGFDKSKLSELDRVSKKALEVIRNHRSEILELDEHEIGEIVEFHLYVSNARKVLFD